MVLVFINKFFKYMSINCPNTIITNNLAIHFDITKLNSWNLNEQLTLTSLTKWNNAVSDDMNLLDFGLTAFDNGRVNTMNTNLSTSRNDTYLKLYRVGYNNLSGGTYYTGYTITAITGSSFGNYFNLGGGYLQGFYKLNGYNYEIFPARYNKGITIETLLEIFPQSKGIFLYMGTRAEDKYNPFFSGETNIISATTVNYGGKYEGQQYTFTGITTSEDNYLVSYDEVIEKYSGFNQPENSDVVIFDSIEQIDNIKSNIIAFEITNDKKIRYKYLDNNGNLIYNDSPNSINRVGWTIISVVYKPYDVIANYDPKNYLCFPRRKGDLIFYINGRKFWKIVDFDEFYFRELSNDKEKQIGVPFNISWGGGSFGLKHSWHYNDFSGNSIIQDTRKSNLLIEKYFDIPYVGNIQKLRIYDVALESNEILQNASADAISNVNYLIAVSKGGRIISQYENVTYAPQETSGSDIRKSIRYRNSDGTYRDLYQMLDIKVIVKSRSNPDVELIKYKKVAEPGWLALIYTNDTSYDFIVPDEITSLHPNEILFAEIKFQWTDPNDIDSVLDKIFVVNITNSNLLNNTVKNY